jgi:hypothetical protein
MKFPYIIVDDFLSNPLSVRNFALEKVEVMQINQGDGKPLRGLRSGNIKDLNKSLYSEIIEKISLCYPPLISYENTHMEFQFTDNTWEGPGWVHVDPSTLTCILYLNENACQNFGTSLYFGKTPNTVSLNDNIKKESNKDVNLRKTEKYKESRRENNDQFIQTMQIGNVFNRMFIFPGDTFHSGDGFFGNSKETSRLTIVTFVY